MVRVISVREGKDRIARRTVCLYSTAVSAEASMQVFCLNSARHKGAHASRVLL